VNPCGSNRQSQWIRNWLALGLGLQRLSGMGEVNRLREVLLYTLYTQGSRFFESPAVDAVRREIGTDGNDTVWGVILRLRGKWLCGG
jgi:hypothetical protein